MDNEKIKEFIENMKLFFKGATDFNNKSKAILEKEAHDEMDNFILLCFGDMLGLPLPTSYYALEILPYIVEDLEHWQKRIMDRKSIWEEKAGDWDFDS